MFGGGMENYRRKGEERRIFSHTLGIQYCIYGLKTNVFLACKSSRVRLCLFKRRHEKEREREIEGPLKINRMWFQCCYWSLKMKKSASPRRLTVSWFQRHVIFGEIKFIYTGSNFSISYILWLLNVPGSSSIWRCYELTRDKSSKSVKHLKLMHDDQAAERWKSSTGYIMMKN